MSQVNGELQSFESFKIPSFKIR